MNINFLKNIKEFKKEIEKKIRQIIHTQCSSNFITREEWNTQSEILFDLQEKIFSLEKRLSYLESKMKNT